MSIDAQNTQVLPETRLRGEPNAAFFLRIGPMPVSYTHLTLPTNREV